MSRRNSLFGFFSVFLTLQCVVEFLLQFHCCPPLIAALFSPSRLSIEFTYLCFLYSVLSLSISSISHFTEPSPAQTDSHFEADEWATAGRKQGFDPGGSQALAVRWAPRIRRAIAAPLPVDLTSPSILPGRSLLLLSVRAICYSFCFLPKRV